MRRNYEKHQDVFDYIILAPGFHDPPKMISTLKKYLVIHAQFKGRPIVSIRRLT